MYFIHIHYLVIYSTCHCIFNKVGVMIHTFKYIISHKTSPWIVTGKITM